MPNTLTVDGMLAYPCEIGIKVMGRNDSTFQNAVLSIIQRHFPQLSEQAIQSRVSKNQQYLSLTIHVNATSQIQMDAVYQELTSDRYCLFVL